MSVPDLVLIAGPTASGKSALALSLASVLGGEIINADSMQVYADLRVLTARPTPEEEGRAPHHLFGSVDGAVNYSVGRWLADAVPILHAIRARGIVPIFVGGTGLYFKALLEGLSEIPPVPETIRERVRAETQALQGADLHARLAALDPDAAARILPNDRLRTLRALEVLTATGRSILAFREGDRVSPLAGLNVRRLFVVRPREELVERIDRRFRTMMKQGALEEVAALAARGLDPTLPVMRAHGVPWLLRYRAGILDLETAIEGGQADTRRYAKRQMTWFRGQMTGWESVGPDGKPEPD